MLSHKKEIDQMVAVLEQEHEDVVALAKELWKLIDKARREREAYVVGVQYEGVGQFVFGMYDSMAQIEKDLSEKGNLKGLSHKDKYKIFKVMSSAIWKDNPTELFDFK